MSNNTKIDSNVYLILNGDLKQYHSQTEAIQSIIFEYIDLKSSSDEAALTIQAANQGDLKDISKVIERAVKQALSDVYTPPKQSFFDTFGLGEFFKELFGADDVPEIKEELKPNKTSATLKQSLM